MDKAIKELLRQREAWRNQFGTSQLSHAIAERDALCTQLAAAQARCGELVQICHEHGVYVDIKISTAALDAVISAALEAERIATAARLDQQLAKAIAAATKPLVDAGNAMRRTMYSNDSDESKAWDAALAQVNQTKP